MRMSSPFETIDLFLSLSAHPGRHSDRKHGLLYVSMDAPEQRHIPGRPHRSEKTLQESKEIR